MGVGATRHMFGTGHTVEDIKEYITQEYSRYGVVVHGSGDEVVTVEFPARFDRMSGFGFDMYFKYQGTITSERTQDGVLGHIRLPGYYTRVGIDPPPKPTDAQMTVVEDEIYKGVPSAAAPSSTVTYTLSKWHVYMVLVVALFAIFFAIVRPLLPAILGHYLANDPDVTIHTNTPA